MPKALAISSTNPIDLRLRFAFLLTKGKTNPKSTDRPPSMMGSRSLFSKKPRYRDKQLNIQSEDIILIYSDGLVENPLPNGTPLGTRNLKKIIESSQNIKTLDQELRNLIASMATDVNSDDVSYILIEKK